MEGLFEGVLPLHFRGSCIKVPFLGVLLLLTAPFLGSPHGSCKGSFKGSLKKAHLKGRKGSLKAFS